MRKGSESGGSTKQVLMQQGRWDKLWLGNCRRNRDLTGRSFLKISRIRKCDPFDAVFDIIIEEEGAASFFGEDKSDDDIECVMKGKHSGIGSDGLALANDGPLKDEIEHPRCYGAFPYVLRRYVREKRALSLEEMVRKVTSFSARRLGLVGRGFLREGMYADVLVLDPDRITDRATFASPCQYSEGILWSIVNGVVVIDGGDHTGAKPGRALLRGRI